ncbi:MAG: hypothetical protein M9894_37685 [Planctomycetes bacterium]|nr:hypothetical protein [Planctomycetota bacterium]
MTGATEVWAEVLRVGGALLEGAQAALDAPLDGPALPASLLALAGAAALVAWRSADAGWPADAAAARAPAGWAGDAALEGALDHGDGAGVLDLATPGGGE